MDFNRYNQAMKSVLFIFLFCLWAIMNTSCTEDFDIKLDHIDPVLIVDGAITDRPGFQYIRLAESAEYFSNKSTPAVSNATVTVYDGFSTVQFNEMSELPGYYRSPEGYLGIAGRTYRMTASDIDINDDGIMETYEAESRLNPVAPIDSIAMDFHREYGMNFWRIWLYAWDPAETVDYYVFKVYKNDTIVSDQIQDWSWVDDEFFKEGKHAEADVYWLEEKDEDGNIQFEAPKLGDSYVLEMDGVTEDYLDFVKAVQTEMHPKVPLFSGPAANVPSNISNGAMGFFTAYSIKTDTLIVTQDILDLKDQ